MSDHAAEVRYLLTDARQLVDALDWGAKAKPNAGGLLIRCPAHDDSDPSCGITKGKDGTLRASCHACGWTADALGMIAHAHNLSTTGDDFIEVLAIGAQIGGDLRLEDEIRNGRPSVDLPPRNPVQPPDPEPERDYPPIIEVGQLWQLAGPISADADAADYLRGRSICPDAATRMGLVRVISPDADLPAWARCKDGLWSKSGHRMIVRVWDSDGKLRSVRSWQLYGGAGPKRLPPSGHKQAGLVQANAHGVRMLLGQAKAGRVLICEGEPDWLTWSTRVPDGVAVFGIGSGSWTPEHAKRIPKGSEVLVLTHCDPAGDKYAQQVVETLPGDRVQLWRLTGPRGVDENDKAKTGQLPQNPREQCEPANELAQRVKDEEPRVFTVVQAMQVVHKRIISEEQPMMWTSGHWLVDMMTGGLRPDSGWVVGGASNWGKSMWLIGMCDENMRNWRNKTVPLIVTGEDGEELYAQRLLARRARVNAMRLRDNCLRPDEHKRVVEAIARSEPKPFYLDGRMVHFERLMRQIVDLVQEHGIKIVALDYIQEFRTKKKYDDDRKMFREMARIFRHTMKHLGAASVILTQLTNPEPGKPPTKEHIRECKDIGHGAEVIAMGWETANDISKDGQVLFPANSKLLLMDKTKSGRKGSVQLSWDPVAACFNRVLQPASMTVEQKDWYDGHADVSQAISMPDEYDDALGAAEGF